MRTDDLGYSKRIGQSLGLLQGKWTVQILCAMRDQPVRLSQLRRIIPTASKKALTASLRTLEATGLIVRRDLSSSVLHIEYVFTEVMRDPLNSLLDFLADWSATGPADRSQ